MEGIIKKISSWRADCITKNGQYFLGDRGITIINNIKPDTGYAATTCISAINIMTPPQYFANEAELAAHDTLWAGNTFYETRQQPAKSGYPCTNG